MKTRFRNATLKVWFAGLSTSRNISNVVEVEKAENMIIVRTKEENTYLLNWNNINLIEEVEGK